MSTKSPTGTTAPERAADSSRPGAVRVAFVLEGGRSREDHAALLQIAAALGQEGAETTILHHGLGRLARLQLRQRLRRLRPGLIVVTGASSTRDVRTVATMLGCPLVCYSWPEGPVHNIHDKYDRLHRVVGTVGTVGTELAPAATPRRVRVLPTRVVVASAAQQREAQHYFSHGQAVLAPDRVHVLPLLPEPPPPGRGREQPLSAPPAANAAALAEHTALLWEAVGERPHRSLGRGLLRGLVARAARLQPRPMTVALAYHQVRRELRGFDLNMVVAEGTLERQVRVLLRRGYQAVTVAAQVELLLRQRRADSPTFSISFDDGYADTLEVAAPLLASLGVPFTVYVITDIMSGAQVLPWYELVAHALLAPALRSRALQVLADQPGRSGDASRTELRRLCAPTALALPPPMLAQAVLAACKALPDSERTALCQALWAELGREVQAQPATPRYLDASGVRRLRDFAAEVSSHSRSHPILPKLGDAALREELAGSRAVLCEHFGDCPGLAYPNGDSDARVEAAAEAAGYKYAIAVTPQAGPPQRFRLGRRMLSELSSLGLDGRFSEDVLWARIRGTLG